MINSGLPDGAEMAEPVRFGNPWHGQVVAAILIHPVGTRPWTEPVDHGGTILFQIPGLATPETPAAEVDLGMRWDASAILCGKTHQLYRRELGSHAWLYVDGDGTRWRVMHSASVEDFAAGTSIAFTFTRFGEFGAAAAMFDLVVALPDWGQATPPIAGAWGPDITRADLTLQDAKSDGAEAIVMLHNTAADAVTYPPIITGYGEVDRAETIIRALGFLTVQISGAGSAIEVAVTVLKTRAQTLGTHSSTTSGSKTTTPYAATNPYGDTYHVTATNGSITESFSYTDRVIGYAYADDVAVPYTVSLAVSRVSDYSGTASLSAVPDEYGFDGATSSSNNEEQTSTLSLTGPTGVLTLTHTDTLLLGGNTIYVAVGEPTATGSSTRNTVYSPALIDPVTVSSSGPAVAVSLSEGEGVVQVTPGGVTPFIAEAAFNLIAFGDARVYRYSPSVFGLYAHTSGGPGKYYGAVGRKAMSTEQITHPAGSEPEYIGYGSDHPISGALMFGQAAPVCYV